MIIDLRSDTVTKPTKAMLDFMLSAEVGDNVLDEDPSVKALESQLATLFGKEAGLFCPSGTMTNQIAIKAHTQPGDEVICEFNSHVYQYEGGGIAFNSGCSIRYIQGNYGRFTAQDLLPHIHNEENIHLPISKLVVVENTCNRAGGSIWDMEHLKSIAQVCQDKKLKFHLDGARIFNALVETGETPLQHGKIFDSISICLSKGLGAPVGSVLLGDHAFIKRAKRIRKVLGGGMRQAGYLAAAGIYALNHHITRLKDDHQRAKKLEEMIKKCAFVDEIFPVNTNILIFKVLKDIHVDAFIQKLKEKNILCIGMGDQKVRFVTHLDFTDNMLEELEKEIKKI